MTGDGVSDAPALRKAGVGVAMGKAGTEAAKDAAGMILTGDDFATLEAAVEEGRGVFGNLTRFIVWTLPANMAEGLVILAADPQRRNARLPESNSTARMRTPDADCWLSWPRSISASPWD